VPVLAIRSRTHLGIALMLCAGAGYATDRPAANLPSAPALSGDLTHRENGFSFRYPRNWRVLRGNSAAPVATYLILVPEDASPQKILVRGEKKRPEAMCAAVHAGLLATLAQVSAGWTERRIPESFDAGYTITTALDPNDRRLPTTLASTVCTNGAAVSVAYEYDSSRAQPDAARLTVMKTLSLDALGERR
jgi:hypothetical protein